MANFFQSLGQSLPPVQAVGTMNAMNQENREAIKFGYLEKQMQEEEARKNRLIPVEVVQEKLGQMGPNTSKFMMGILGNSVKDYNGAKVVRKRDLDDMLEVMKTDSGLSDAFAKHVYDDHRQKYFEIDNQLKSITNPESPKYADLSKQKEQAYKDLSAAATIMELREIAKQQAKHTGNEMPGMDKWFGMLVAKKISEGYTPEQAVAYVRNLRGSPNVVGYSDFDTNGNPTGLVTVQQGPNGPITTSIPVGSGAQVANQTGSTQPGSGGFTPKDAPKLTNEAQTSIEMLNNLRSDLNQVKSSWGTSGTPERQKAEGFVGPIAARTGGVVDKTALANPDRAALHANVQAMKNKLVYLRSGKQINEAEYQRLEKELPNITDPVPVFDVKINRFERELGTIMDTKRKLLQATGTRNASQIDKVIGGGTPAPKSVPAPKIDPISAYEELRRRGLVQ